MTGRAAGGRAGERAGHGSAARGSAAGRAAGGRAGERAPARRTGAQAHARYEELVARAMTAEDPVAALRAAARDPALPPALRRALIGADEDGVRMSALLVARLRFERLLRGSPEAEAWFDRDAAEFSAAFRRYHAEVPPTAFFPPGEARLFRRWLEAQSAEQVDPGQMQLALNAVVQALAGAAAPAGAAEPADADPASAPDGELGEPV
ncbi:MULTISPECIES: hypothetical protein [Sorangium]|uniref:Uncharacterized protein n=1 Tax=Sorangium cellulosum TaxID=56 RepID=A0A4P2QFV4_SORCE|nr:MULTISPECIES: hypothetical protein [Sorangium]AUX28113.1 uncharacterized protein SOCE836_001810 [Sorangium cellulosum]WCQ87517.1 hypothetical protein NQZ70_00180 [Sorangium sp. Soce836]